MFNISLTKRYIPAVMLIAIFIVVTNILNTNAIQSNKEFGKIINISGKQRMLSQKLFVLSSMYFSNQSLSLKKEIEDTLLDVEDSHIYLKTKVFTNELKEIYSANNLDKSLKEYLLNFYHLLETNDKRYIESAKYQSKVILIQLDNAVKEYEKYANSELDKMTNYESILMLLTLSVLLFEILFIFRPAANQIEENSKRLKQLNNQLEAKVREQTKELQKNIDIVSAYVIYSKTDLKGIITEVSDAFCKISGYTHDELIGKSHNIIRHIDMSSSIFKNIWKTIENNQEWSGEVKNHTKKGGYYWTSSIITPEYDDKNNKIGYISIRHDITSKKDFEQQTTQLIQAEKLATLGEMIGNIAHQWRQPLSAITSTASSLKVEYEFGILDIKDVPIKMDKIVLKANFLSETINTFRDFIKGDKVYKEIILQDEINQALSVANAVFNENSIKIETNLNTSENIKITMSTGELPQVLINIFNNSKDILVDRKIKHPKIILNVLKKEDCIVITIEDNGQGVPLDIMTKIFDPYFTTKHQSQGTGLGLHMSYQIVTESLKGKLYAKNTNNGAKFFIELPLV